MTAPAKEGDRFRVRLHCRTSTGGDVGARVGEPVTCGVPFPPGLLGSAADLVLEDERHERTALQARVLDRWSDGSVRWALLDWLASVDGEGATYVLRAEEGRAAEADSADEDCGLVVDVGEEGASVNVSTGAACFRLRTGGGFPFDRVTIEGEATLGVARSGLFAEEGSGVRYEARVDRVQVTETGSVRAVVDVIGHLTAEGEHPLADLRARLHFSRRRSTVGIELTITNPRRARHPGNIWQLGDAGSIYLRDLALVMALPSGDGPVRALCSPEAGLPYREACDEVELYQDSSGGENWGSSNHVDRHGQVPLAFRGYYRRTGEERREGLRAAPVIALRRAALSLAMAPRYFWQDFPMALEARGTALTLRLFPRQSRSAHELQGGERKTHLLTVAFGHDGVTHDPLAWCRSPLLIHAEPVWYATAQAVPGLQPRCEEPHADYLELVDLAIEGETSFERRREVVDEYGWRHFGDLWADHEAVRHSGPEPLISHYNNQYDALYGCATQFLRSADRRWFELMTAMARHVTDIDLYHTEGDKSAYNHGQFWHTVHYTDAGSSTHRSYPAAEGVSGGGPSAGHLYTSGLMAHYFMTGCERSREAVIALGGYVLAADDGTRSIFRFVDRGRTGHVTLSAPGYHGPGRSAANSLNALIDADRLSAPADRRFLDKAEEIIARVIHPADDLEALHLLDAETRWFYTMFLQALGKYLEHKAELDQIDASYAYARAALLHYARWAVENEEPYLVRREALQFPTETWPAQDMRKSEVFHFAARHVDGEERRRLQDRAAYFFHYTIDTLRSLPTRGLCRPVVLMLTCGYRQAYFERHRDEQMPRPADKGLDFGRPRHFVAQRQRVERKLAVGAVAALALIVSLLAAWVAQ